MHRAWETISLAISCISLLKGPQGIFLFSKHLWNGIDTLPTLHSTAPKALIGIARIEHKSEKVGGHLKYSPNRILLDAIGYPR